jgi:hypothetical protein
MKLFCFTAGEGLPLRVVPFQNQTIAPPSSLGAVMPTVPGTVSTLSSPGLILCPASDPIPHRLVRRIQAGDFIEMRELLADNIALYNRFTELQGVSQVGALPPAVHPQIREVPSLISWTHCILAYMAVRTEDPLSRDMLGYARLVIREALRHGGSGWQEYDRCFRRQVAINTSFPWNVLNSSLQASTLLGAQGGTCTWCPLCQEPDHMATQCALAPLQQGVLNSQANTASSIRTTGRQPLHPPRRLESQLRVRRA